MFGRTTCVNIYNSIDVYIYIDIVSTYDSLDMNHLN